jgi:hypothetical protein
MGEVVAKRALGRLRRYFGPEFAKGSCQTACQSLKRPVVPRGDESLCAFLNARGGQVLFGGGRDSQAAGQSVRRNDAGRGAADSKVRASRPG